MSLNPSDVAKGREGLTYFHNASIGYDGYDFRSVDELLKGLNARTPKADPNIFLDSFGFTINNLGSQVGFDSGDLKNAMVNLAKQAKGRIPESNSTFFSSLSNQVQNVSWKYVALNTVTESASQIATGAQVVGQQVIATAGGLLNILPIVAVLGVVGYVYFRVKRG